MTSISVVIPVLDDARMLEACLASLSRQTRPAEEVIVVDNGCTDDSVAVALRWGATVVREDRPGITAASARGFDLAAGDVIARCDADSRLPDTWLEHIERRLEETPDAVAITGPATFYDLHGVGGAVARLVYISGFFVAMRVMLAHNVLFGSNCAVRAAAWDGVSAGVPRDDREIHDDMDLSYRLPAADDVLYDRTLVVEISRRPFDSATVVRRRLTRTVHTFAQHWPQQLPHHRWAARRRAHALRQRATLLPTG